MFSHTCKDFRPSEFFGLRPSIGFVSSGCLPACKAQTFLQFLPYEWPVTWIGRKVCGGLPLACTLRLLSQDKLSERDKEDVR